MSCYSKCQTVENRRNMEEEKLHFSDFMQLAVHILYNETNLPLMHHIKIESRIGCKYFVFFTWAKPLKVDSDVAKERNNI